MNSIVTTKYGKVKATYKWDAITENESIELTTLSDEYIGAIRNDDYCTPPKEFILVADDGEEIFNIPLIVKWIEDYVAEDDYSHELIIMILTATLSERKVNVLYVSDVDMLITSKVLLVLDSNCNKDVAIKAIVEAIKKHEDYENCYDTEEDDSECPMYSDEELTAKAVRIWEYSEEFWADKTFGSTFYIKKNMPIVG